MSCNLSSQDRGLPILRHLRSWSPDFNGDPSTFWPKAYDTVPFDIIARSGEPKNYRTSYNLVDREATKSLDPEDQKDGYVYLYEIEGNKGLVEFGYTCRSLETRHAERRFHCNKIPKLLYPLSGTAIMIPNARRVKALCYAELGHCRITVYCRGCLKQHNQWFEISAAEAIKTIQK